MSKILPWLYLGGRRDAENLRFLQEAKIQVVINVAQELQQMIYPRDLTVLRVSLLDEPWEDITGYFDLLWGYFEISRLRGLNVLIHCAAGRSRSVSFVIFYLMKSRGYRLTQALRFIQDRRPQAGPNRGFLYQLFRARADLLHVSLTGFPKLGLLSYGEKREESNRDGGEDGKKTSKPSAPLDATSREPPHWLEHYLDSHPSD